MVVNLYAGSPDDVWGLFFLYRFPLVLFILISYTLIYFIYRVTRVTLMHAERALRNSELEAHTPTPRQS